MYSRKINRGWYWWVWKSGHSVKKILWFGHIVQGGWHKIRKGRR